MDEPLTHEIPYKAGAESDRPWDGVQPLNVNRYLWLDNGYEPEVHVKLYYTAERLHVRFQVFEEQPLIRYRQADEPVYRDSCVEFFLQPLPETDERYLNFEWNAAGTLLLGIGESWRGRQPLPGGFQRSALFGIRSAVGLVEAGSGRTYWELESSIPFNWLQREFPGFRAEAGRAVRGNFFKCGDDAPMPHFGVWNPVTAESPNFHRSCDFGRLVFGPIGAI